MSSLFDRFGPDATERVRIPEGTILDCGHPATQTDGIGTGYAWMRKTREAICYACADERQRADVASGKPMLVYHTDYGKPGTPNGRLTTWTGGDLGMRVVSASESRGNIGRFVNVHARDTHGRLWYGRHSRDWSEAVTMRRLKGKAASR